MPESRLYGPAPAGLRGEVAVPGDKSVSHRALLLGAVSESTVDVSGFLPSADTLATLAAVRALGVEVQAIGDSYLRIVGRGWGGLREPDDVIDVGNAGTLMRLLPGLVAGRPFLTVLTGDESIRRRPMERVLRPLADMGAVVMGRARDTLAPLGIKGGPLRGLSHELEVASAQVKSCILLAALQAQEQTELIEPAPTRDHTERMIAAAGGTIESTPLEGGRVRVTVRPLEHPHLRSVRIPGDFSSAAFLLVAALLLPDSAVTVRGVGLNPSRTTLLTVLERMGADLSVELTDATGPEPVGDVTARTSRLHAVDIDADTSPLLIDELPIWALAAARAEGRSRLRGAAELRVKESDRISAVAALLGVLGVEVAEQPDGLDIMGRRVRWEGGRVTTKGDHRVAMVGAIAGLLSERGVEVDDDGCVLVSFPGFAATIDALRVPGGSE